MLSNSTKQQIFINRPVKQSAQAELKCFIIQWDPIQNQQGLLSLVLELTPLCIQISVSVITGRISWTWVCHSITKTMRLLISMTTAIMKHGFHGNCGFVVQLHQATAVKSH